MMRHVQRRIQLFKQALGTRRGTRRQALVDLEGFLKSTMACADSRRQLPKLVRWAVRNVLLEINIARRAKDSKKEFQALKGRKGLKVNLGCGSDIRAGFVNIDLFDPERVYAHENSDIDAIHEAILIDYDLRLGLPLEDDSCDLIYSSHFFEHLAYQDGLHLMHDCYKALRPEGVFRMALPDMKAAFDAYLREDDEYFGTLDPLSLGDKQLRFLAESGTMARVDWVNYGVYQSGEHKYIYDEEKAISVLQQVGFGSAVASSYLDGIDMDDPLRRKYSFYIEAVK